MAGRPIITFKAGKCDLSEHVVPLQGTVTPDPTPGYLYFWQEDELMHFCWRKRSQAASDPEIELFMIAGDACFRPYTGSVKSEPGKDFQSPGNGRICVLKFHSSGERYLFWLQSTNQHPDGKSNWFSQRDLKMIKVIDSLLAGEDLNAIDMSEPVTFRTTTRKDSGDDDDDEEMGDADAPGLLNSTGGAGPGAAGGDFRQEGEEAREGGEDGARA